MAQPLLLHGQVKRAVEERQLRTDAPDRRALDLPVRHVLLDARADAERPALRAEEGVDVLPRREHGVLRAVLSEVIVLRDEFAQVGEREPRLVGDAVPAAQLVETLLPRLARLSGFGHQVATGATC